MFKGRFHHSAYAPTPMPRTVIGASDARSALQRRVATVLKSNLPAGATVRCNASAADGITFVCEFTGSVPLSIGTELEMQIGHLCNVRASAHGSLVRLEVIVDEQPYTRAKTRCGLLTLLVVGILIGAIALETFLHFSARVRV